MRQIWRSTVSTRYFTGFGLNDNLRVLGLLRTRLSSAREQDSERGVSQSKDSLCWHLATAAQRLHHSTRQKTRLPLFQLARVLAHFDHAARSANHNMLLFTSSSPRSPYSEKP